MSPEVTASSLSAPEPSVVPAYQGWLTGYVWYYKREDPDSATSPTITVSSNSASESDAAPLIGWLPGLIWEFKRDGDSVPTPDADVSSGSVDVHSASASDAPAWIGWLPGDTWEFKARADRTAPQDVTGAEGL